MEASFWTLSKKKSKVKLVINLWSWNFAMLLNTTDLDRWWGPISGDYICFNLSALGRQCTVASLVGFSKYLGVWEIHLKSYCQKFILLVMNNVLSSKTSICGTTWTSQNWFRRLRIWETFDSNHIARNWSQRLLEGKSL